MDRLRIAAAQLNPIVGDVAGNLRALRRAFDAAHEAGAALVVTSELFVTGYPAEDLLLNRTFQAEVATQVEAFAAALPAEGPGLLLGTPWVVDGRLHNAVLLVEGGRIADLRIKRDLPNYGVFDEKRIFAPGPLPAPLPWRGLRLGVPICEDIWSPTVTEALAAAGAELLLVPNASPFTAAKQRRRREIVAARAAEAGLALLYVNQLGGQDELVFDGASFAMNADGSLAAQAPDWTERLLLTDWSRDGDGRWHCLPGETAALGAGSEALYRALVTGLRDYVNKNRFPGVILGLSGGIDSALAAAVAVDALGAERVTAVMMPYRYTSRDSLEDAAEVARLLGIRLHEVSIAPAVDAFTGMLAPLFEGKAADTTEENLQSRARGILLMALSNKFGPMVLSTGNKSEMSVGYATLYGDMCGGYAVLKDVYKMAVFALCQWRNGARPADGLGPDGPAMPQRVIDKPPSAELRPDQKDEDSLPPYPVLDAVLEALIEHDDGIAEAAQRTGHDIAIVARIARMLQRAEYKRRQAPPGVIVTPRSLSRDRRYPITSGVDFPM